MVERDIDLLLRILDHCDRIHSCINRFGSDFQMYLGDPDYQDVIKLNLFQIGECVNRISDETKEKNQSIPWHEIHELRNVIAHGYIKIKEERIWDVVQTDIPNLKAEISLILQKSGLPPESYE